jgi:hypothetical protein
MRPSRSPRNFDAVLGLYRTNKLHLAAGVCVQDFCEELEYWGLDDLHMEPCCQHTYYRARWLLPAPKIDVTLLPPTAWPSSRAKSLPNAICADID